MIEKIKKIISERENKLIFGNISLSLLLKFLSLIFSLINTKLYITYFNNNDVLGVWYSIVSILNWIVYFDLGIGNGLRNEIVGPLERKDEPAIKKIISTGYIVVIIISLLVTSVLLCASFFVNWNKFLNIPDTILSKNTLLKVAIISVIGVGLQFSLKTIISIFQAMRKTSVSGLLALLLNVLVFIYLKVVPSGGVEKTLLSFTIFYQMAVNVPLIVLTVYLFGLKMRRCRPSIKAYDKNVVSKIAKLGISFFIIQIALLIISSTDSWLITYFFDPENTVDYQIYYRLFSVVLTIFALFTQTVWSSVTKYYEEKNVQKIMWLYKMLNGVAAIGGTACIIIAIFYGKIVNIWMSDAYDADKITISIALMFAIWMITQMIINTSTAIANGIGRLKIQTIFIPIGGVIKIIGILILSRMGCQWDVIVIMNVISLVPLAIAQHIDIRHALHKLTEQPK